MHVDVSAVVWGLNFIGSFLCKAVSRAGFCVIDNYAAFL